MCKDASDTASVYLPFTVLDEVCAGIADGGVTFQGKMTMLGST